MRRCAALLALSVLGAAPGAWATVGLSSQFVDVVMEGLEPGKEYNLLEMRGLPYTVKNRGDGPVEVLVEVQPPTTAEVLAPFEPIPNPSWFSITPDRYRLNPGEPGYSALTIRLPDDPSIVGRHFQGEIWAHTVQTGFMAAGVKSKIRFSVGKGPETLAEEERRKAMVMLNYDMWPAAMYVMKAKAGPYDVQKAEGKSFKLTNRGDKPLEVVLKPVRWTRSSLPPGYTAAEDVSWAKFVPEKVTVEPDTLQTVKLMLDVPPELKGKKVAFIMQITLPIGTVVNMTNRVLVEVE